MKMMSGRFPVILMVIMVGSCASVCRAQKSKPSRNSSGSWSLDLAKSEFGESPKPKSARLTVALKGKSLSWTSDVVGAHGNHTKLFFDGAMDGQEYPVRSEPDTGAVSVSYSQNTDGTTHATSKSPTGITEMTISVSGDARTLVIKNELTDNSGDKVTWSEVWKRNSNAKRDK